MRTTTSATAILILLLATPATAQTRTDWPEWRGPLQSMVAPADGVFDDGFELAVAWRTPLGPGYSAVSVAGERAVTMFSDGESDLIAAFDAADGAELWRYRIGATYRGHSGAEDGPVGTPTIHRGAVYALGPEGDLIALDLADGGERWRRQLVEDFGSKAPVYGFSAAPIVAGEILVVAAGGSDGRAIVGLDPATGELRWSAGDDTVGYQSPRLARIAGVEQVLAATDVWLYGLDPASGEELWRHRHREKGEHDGGMAQPVLVGDDGVLLHAWDESVLVRIERAGDGWAPREAWRDRSISNNAVTPIYHDGALYGFRGRFLTRVDPETGEARWKSRPPGTGGIAIVDDHLVTLATDGELVVAAVDAGGYDERARLAVAERYSLAPPSFAGGRLFLRDTKELIAVDVRPSSRASSGTEAAGGARDVTRPRRARTGFEAFLTRLEAAPEDERPRLVDEYLAGRETLPVIEDEGRRVHFLFRGAAEEAALAGDFLDVGEEVSMRRVPGTDLWHYAVELEPAARYAYRFALDYDHATPDPRNPHRRWTPDGLYSELRTPGWRPPEHLAEPAAGTPRGRIETFELRSEALRSVREVHVWLPPGYDRGDARYPLLLVLDGDDALRYGHLDRALDNLLAAGRITPAVVVFVPSRDGGEYRTRAGAHGRMLVEELLPRLETRYRLGGERAIHGAGDAAWAAIRAATDHPGRFAAVALQSFFFYPYGEDWAPRGRETLIERLETAGGQTLPARWHVEWSRHDLASVSGLREANWIARDAGGDSRLLADLLKGKRGVVVTTVEVAGGAGWTGWGAGADRVLRALLPPADETTASSRREAR